MTKDTFATDTRHDEEIAPELIPLHLADKPDGPGAAAMLSAGIGIFMLGFFTTGAVISAGLNDFLAWWEWGQGVGPLAGKSTVSVIIWLVSWVVLHMVWKDRDVDIKKMFYIGLGLGIAGAIMMFPPFFELFHG